MDTPRRRATGVAACLNLGRKEPGLRRGQVDLGRLIAQRGGLKAQRLAVEGQNTAVTDWLDTLVDAAYDIDRLHFKGKPERLDALALTVTSTTGSQEDRATRTASRDRSRLLSLQERLIRRSLLC